MLKHSLVLTNPKKGEAVVVMTDEILEAEVPAAAVLLVEV